MSEEMRRIGRFSIPAKLFQSHAEIDIVNVLKNYMVILSYEKNIATCGVDVYAESNLFEPIRPLEAPFGYRIILLSRSTITAVKTEYEWESGELIIPENVSLKSKEEKAKEECGRHIVILK